MPRPANTPSQMCPVGQDSPAQSGSEAPPEPPHERSRLIHPDASSCRPCHGRDGRTGRSCRPTVERTSKRPSGRELKDPPPTIGRELLLGSVRTAMREPCGMPGGHRSPPAPERIGRTNLPSIGPGRRGPFAGPISRAAEEDGDEDRHAEEVRSMSVTIASERCYEFVQAKARLMDQGTRRVEAHPGVITISRQAGSGAHVVAQDLVERFQARASEEKSSGCFASF